MLKWFKTITNRLFGEDDNDENKTIHTTTEEQDDEEQEEFYEKPVFRFPIITDAEIYGWDEDEIGTARRQEDHVPSAEPEDDYEPIPLYENERWPQNDVPVNVYRANHKPIYEEDQEVERGFFSAELKPPYKRESKFDKVVKKSPGNRFVPTDVPSPIHGYASPKRQENQSVFGQEREDAEQNRYLKDDTITEVYATQEVIQQDETPNLTGFRVMNEPIIEEQESHVEEKPVELIEKSILKEMVSETSVVEEQPEDLGAEEVFKAPIVEAQLEELVTQEVSEPPIVEEKQLEDLVAEEIFEAPIAEEQLEELVTQGVSEPPIVEEQLEDLVAEEVYEAPIAEEQLEELVTQGVSEPRIVEEQLENLGAEEVSTESIEDNLSDEKVLEEPKKKERIVPFNVLMLKSDKEKLSRSEQKVINLEQPEIKQEAILDEPVLEENAELEHYVFPSIDYLIPPESQIEDTEWLDMQSEKLEESLSHFGVTATVIEAVQGPTVTRFEFTVGQGTKVSRVRNLTDDLKLTLAARDIRIQAPIPGKSSIGIEIPNRQTRPVRISEVIQTDAFMKSNSPLEAVLGLGLTGEPVTIDLRKMPHGMIAGATGSGKSVCINSILVSLLYKASPSDLKMMLIDPKMVELAPFNGIPHLISPVITDVKAATAALKWAVNEMERRYELLAHAGVRDIERYNKAATENRQYSLKMPYLLIVIDELADLMMMAPADVEVSISRIAQKARACGIHLIIATQRPSVDVITGTIKANIPTRIAFSVSSQVDSRTIIDTNGAERLLGKGDMLYIGNGQSTSARLQGTFVTDDEIERIIEHVQNEASPTYLFGQDELLKSAVEEEDSLFTEACLFIYQQDSASTSMLQRNFSIGYNRAAKLMDRMEKHGFISAQQGSKARDVYLTESDLEQLSEPAF